MIKPGTAVPVQGAYATPAEELRRGRFYRGVPYHGLIYVRQPAPFLPGMGAGGQRPLHRSGPKRTVGP